jgi:hypothetical protein
MQKGNCNILILCWCFTSDFFPVLEEGVALFFPFIGLAAPFEMRQQKRGLQLQKSGVMRKENSGEKKERNQMEGAATKSYFPYSVW